MDTTDDFLKKYDHTKMSQDEYVKLIKLEVAKKEKMMKETGMTMERMKIIQFCKDKGMGEFIKLVRIERAKDVRKRNSARLSIKKYIKIVKAENKILMEMELYIKEKEKEEFEKLIKETDY